MKFFHLSDLHPGKKVNEFSVIEAKERVDKQIIVTKEKSNGSAVRSWWGNLI